MHPGITDGAPEEPMMDVARGDKAVSKHLRASLEVLRDTSGDPDFRRQLDDVLAGHLSLREAAFSGVFERGIQGPLETGMAWYESLPEDERERLAGEGEAEFARIAEEIQDQERRG
ncbi:MAG: hypothetical protein HOV79_35035 [Hamadaea sp.]|nr:hypothetical protein [Hamadaea sp.]